MACKSERPVAKRAWVTLMGTMLLAACGDGGTSATAATPASSAPVASPTPAPAPNVPATPKAAAIATLPMGRCVNMANALEAPNEGDWGRRIAADDFAIIAAAGFDSVRIPVRWSGHAAAGSPYAIDPAFLNRVAAVVDLALAAKLNVLLDDHNYDALFTDPVGERDRLAGLWRQIATAFKDRPRDKLWFEIENEPHGQLTNAKLVATLSPALVAIRETNPDRPVVIGGDGYSNVDALSTLTLPTDDYVVPTFHYYSPFEFTHQGAGWVTPVPPVGRTYGGAADQAQLSADVQKVRNYIARTGKTPLMGEFGAYETVPLAQRTAYYAATRIGFEAAGTGACAWGYTSSFPLYDSVAKAWLPGMLSAMGVK